MVSSTINGTPSDDPDATALTLLEARVLDLFWQGKTQAPIARAINRSPRTVRRIIRQLETKLQPIRPHLILLRLEDKLLARVPTMKDADLIAALRLYLPITRSAATEPSPATASNREIQSLIREAMT